jgi:hypothetical protein
VGGFWSVDRKFAHMPPDSFELPTESVNRRWIALGSEELVYQARYDVRAQRKARRPVVRLLPLEPSTFEKRFVIQNVQRRPNLTE